MPVIMEEDDNALPAGFQQLIDETAFTAANTTNTVANVSAANAARPTCPMHPNVDDCLCQSFVGEWDLAETNAPSMAALEEPDYSKFENWIPQCSRPEKPCDYCRARRLDCYVQRGEPFCTPCASLFRECSLTNSEARNSRDKVDGTFVDTLHQVFEDAAIEQGGLTGIKPLKSKGGRASGTVTPVRDDALGSSKRNGIRFPRHAIKTLRDWLESHADNPYPTDEEKVHLEERTELSATQIANWLANARRRRKANEKSKPRLAQSPSLNPSTPAIAIPASTNKRWDELLPLERWKNSPPENEPASINDIYNAVVNTEFDEAEASTSPSSYGRRDKGSSNGSGFSMFRAPSTTSQETISGHTSSLSASSAAFSRGSSNSRSTHGSFGSFSSSLAGKKDRRRRRRPAPINASANDKKRIFQCTFCTDTFKSKYDWTRYEKSLHLSLEKWICAPLGPAVTNVATGLKTCAYCDAANPDYDHLESHNHRQCEDKGLDARTFYRKDHLRQHLRLMHGCPLTPKMESWRSTAVAINSRCGFCGQRFSAWQERVDHLTAHFKAGARMIDWKGCRGFDPAVAAQVTNAMPPYLIGMESASPCPFSATNRSACEARERLLHGPGDLGLPAHTDLENAEKNASGGRLESSGVETTCWEILTIRLAMYAKKMASQGIIMTDEMLQSQARHIIYDSDDTWNQTAADNAEWLDLFKKAAGLDFVPSTIGGQGLQVPEDLETYQDLGLRIPFAVQLQAYNQYRNGTEMSDARNVPGPYQRALELRRSDLKDVYNLLTRANALYEGKLKCGHAECEVNNIDITLVDDIQAKGPRMRRWCNQDIMPDQAKYLARVRGLEHSEGVESLTGDSGLSRACSFNVQDNTSCYPATSSLGARALGLESLAQAESSLSAPFAFDALLKPVNQKPLQYLRRHKYQLPAEKARLFATTTGPWEDSGKMPAAVSTFSPPVEPAQSTSTGAMIEFLGGDVGASLPFINDALTSEIPLDGMTWNMPYSDTLANDAGLNQELDEFIRAATAPELQSFGPTLADMEMPSDVTMDFRTNLSVSSLTSLPVDAAMDDISFDDMTFDGVFDMPLESTFESNDGNGSEW